MSMDLDRELLKALDVEASSERVQDLALQAVQKAANESLKEGLVTTSVEKTASAETGARIGGALGLSPGAAIGAAIGADKGDKLRSALLAGGGGLLGGAVGYQPGRIVGNVLETKSLSSRRMRNALLAARLAQVLGAVGGSSMGAGAAIKSFGKKKKASAGLGVAGLGATAMMRNKEKRASAGAGAVIGSALGGVVPGSSLLTGPLGAALGANLGKTQAERQRRNPERSSAEARAAVGDLLGRLGGGALGAGAGAGLGAGIGAMLPVVQQRYFKDALSEMVGSGKPLTPRAAAILAGAGLGAGVGGLLGSPLGGALGAYKGAKGAFKRKEAAFADGEVVLRALNAARHAKTTKTMKREKKKGKEKKASVLFYGLRHASDAGYENYMHKTAFIGQAFKAGVRRAGGRASQVGDAFFGGAPVKGAVFGGGVGALGGAGAKAFNINQIRKAVMANPANMFGRGQGALKNYMGAEDFGRYVAAYNKNLAGKTLTPAEAAILSRGDDITKQIGRIKGIEGRNLQGFDKLKAYAGEFAPDLLASGTLGGLAGAASGAAGQQLLRRGVRQGVKDLGKSMLPLGAAAVGGGLVGAAIS